MTRRRLLDDVGLARRNNALDTIRRDARARVLGGRLPANYNNARRILTDEYGLTDAQIALVWRNARDQAAR